MFELYFYIFLVHFDCQGYYSVRIVYYCNLKGNFFSLKGDNNSLIGAPSASRLENTSNEYKKSTLFVILRKLQVLFNGTTRKRMFETTSSKNLAIAQWNIFFPIVNLPEQRVFFPLFLHIFFGLSQDFPPYVFLFFR